MLGLAVVRPTMRRSSYRGPLLQQPTDIPRRESLRLRCSLWRNKLVPEPLIRVLQPLLPLARLRLTFSHCAHHDSLFDKFADILIAIPPGIL